MDPVILMDMDTEVFEFAVLSQKLADLSQLRAALDNVLSSFQIGYHVGGQLVSENGQIKTTPLFFTKEHPWLRHYVRENLFLDDPTPRWVKKTIKPFTWKWYQDNFQLSRAEQNVFAQARQFNLHDGVIFPFHGADRSLGSMSFAADRLFGDYGEITRLQVIAQAAYVRAMDLVQAEPIVTSNPLSKRQRECLNWAQHGKSNQEIADILSISAHTVKDHIDAAKALLGVNTRIEAIIRARNANYIGFSPLSDRSYLKSPD